MIELKINQDKKTLLQIGLISLIYIAAVISFVLILLPRMNEVTHLQDAVAHEQSQVEVMERMVSMRPQIEAGIKEQAETAAAYEKLIPAAYNLPEVMASIENVAGLYNLELISLDYKPAAAEDLKTWYPMSLEVFGNYQDVSAALQSLIDAFPSLYIRSLAVAGGINEQVYLDAEFDLYIIPTGWTVEESWQRPTLQRGLRQTRNVFGVPLQYLEEVYADSLRLIGVVRVHGGEPRALVSFNGEQEWKTIGDSLGIGTIVDVHESALVLDIHGVILSINMGGSRSEG